MLNPGFFQNEVLIELDPLTRLLFAGLWTIADREGRLEDRPKRIKLAILPADDYNVDAGLTELHTHGFIERYDADGVKCIQINKFTAHQKPHPREASSVLPTQGLPKANLGAPKANLGHGEAMPRWPVSNSVSDPVSDPDPKTETPAAAAVPRLAGTRRPMPEYPRLGVFRWMVDDLLNMLGAEAVDFDLDAYLLRLDQSGKPLPADIWPWLKTQVAEEAESRRQPARTAATTDYDNWRTECRKLHDGKCAHYQMHLVQVAKDEAASVERAS